MPDSSIPRAPVGLGLEGRRLWRAVLTDFMLESWQLAILRTACEAADRVAEARECVKRDGLVVTGKFGAKAHPALAVERDARISLLRALRELSLDTSQAEQYARPAPIRGRYEGAGR
jgi:P27 family predicted phage terminase small subunit